MKNMTHPLILPYKLCIEALKPVVESETICYNLNSRLKLNINYI